MSIAVISKWESGNYTGNIPLYLAHKLRPTFLLTAASNASQVSGSLLNVGNDSFGSRVTCRTLLVSGECVLVLTCTGSVAELLGRSLLPAGLR